MAEDIRPGHTKEPVVVPTEALIQECKRQAESCQYTGAGLYIWQKHARCWRAAFLVAPIILGGIGGSQILLEYGGDIGKIVGLVCALLAGFFPAIYVALNMDMRVSEIGRSAAEFTNLRDRFRQAAEITQSGSWDEFRASFELLMDRMDTARAVSPPLPEWAFKRAQRKINRGDYDFNADRGG